MSLLIDVIVQGIQFGAEPTQATRILTWLTHFCVMQLPPTFILRSVTACASFEVSTAVCLKIPFCWDVTLCHRVIEV